MSRPSALLRKVYPLAFSTPRRLRIALNLFPPLGASGIHIREVADDWSYARITLRLRWWNKNMHGAAFGGTLFSMTDAFFGTLVMNRLGQDYEAWTRTGTFQYLNPGRTGDTLHVSVPDELIAQIRTRTASATSPTPPSSLLRTAPPWALASKTSTYARNAAGRRAVPPSSGHNSSTRLPARPRTRCGVETHEAWRWPASPQQ